jgi:cytoskeletal protein CcmA (bactofilin family)
MFGREKAIAQLDAPPAPRPSAMPIPESSPTESVLATSLTVKGDVEFEGAMRIEGEVHGRITGQGLLTVNRGGKVIGDIVAAEVVIEGTVQGNVTAADRMVLSETAQVVGDVKATRLVGADGAKILGRLDISSDALTLASTIGSARPEPAEDPLDKAL